MHLGELWPLANLRVVHEDLELRWPAEQDLVDLAALAAEGVHDPAEMPFTVPWTDGDAARNVLTWQWQTAGAWRPEAWRLNLVAVVRGEVVGTQGAEATEFAVRREACTGSWIGRAHQGRGYGVRQRVCMLHLLFAGLGAETARSDAMLDNAASLAVSRRLGYREDGRQVVSPRGERVESQRLLLARDAWKPPFDVEIHGLEACRADFGLS